MSTSLTWQGSVNTNIGDELNWNPAETPSALDAVVFEQISNGGTLTGSASALVFAFGGLNPWVLNGATLTAAGQSEPPYLPFAGAFLTNVTLTTATLNAAGGTTYIGGELGSPATVTAESGSTVTTEGDNLGEEGQIGSLVLTGSGTTWTEEESGGSGGFITVGLQGAAGSPGGTGYLSVTNDASLVTQGSATLGQDSGSQGFGTLASGGVWSTNGLVAGESGAGTLTINSGGTLLNGGTFSAIGENAGSTGELVIEADGTYASTLPSESNGFALAIGDNGASGTLAAATGTALVTGTDATLNLNGSPLAVGLNGGTGSLTIADGGAAEVGTSNSGNSALSVGQLGTGTVTVTGAGSTITAAGPSSIGQGGSGTLVVENDGIAQIEANPTVTGGLSIGTGSTSAGQPTGGTGTAIVSNGGLLYSAQDIDVGGAGVSGALDINAGIVEAGTRVLAGNAAVVSGTTEAGSGVINIGAAGTLDIEGNGITAAGTAALSIGTFIGTTLAGGGSGTVNVIGAGAVLNAGSNYINIGNSGTGEMTVGQGGSVLSGQQFSADAAALIGNHPGAQGLLTVTDAGSVFQAQGQMDVGVDGSGALLIENGGSVITGNNTILPRGGLVIGWGSGSSGSVTVTGTGSELSNTGQLEVGGSGNVNSGTAQTGGTGSLQIEAGGTVVTNLPSSGYTGPAADIAADPGTDGSSVTVTGTDSTWNVGGTLVVGDAAAGSLGVSAGGTVNAGALVVGGQSGGNGNVDITGATSTLVASGDITVGGQSDGDLSLDGGAYLSGGTLAIGNNAGVTGLVNLQGEDFVQLAALTVGGNGGAGVLVEGGGVLLDVTGAEVVNSGGVLVTAGDPVNNFGSGTISSPQTISANTVNNYASGLYNNSTVTVDNNSILFEIAPTIDVNTSTFGDWLIGSNSTGGSGTLVVDAGTITADQLINFSTVTAGALDIANVGSAGSFSNFNAVIDNFASGFAALYLQPITTQTTITHGQTLVSGATQGAIDPIGSATLTATGGSIIANGTTVSYHDLVLYGGADETGSVLGTLAVSDSITAPDLSWLETVNADGGLGALPCFAEGTLIRTERGDVAVQTLRPGDLVRVVGVGEGFAPVVWVGHRRVDCRRHPKPRLVWPVRVAAGAFGPGRPGRDLWLSPDHALFLEGVLIPVKYLIDGGAITQVACEEITYYHVELPRHAVLLAEGLAAESYLEAGDRGNFANGGSAVALYPDFATLRWEAEGCAPLVVTGPKVEAARAMVAERRARAA